jgi:cytochrome c oxidase subunit III
LETTVQTNAKELWSGGDSPFKVSYGKIMMWYFLISDTFSFAGLLISYGAIRLSQPAHNPEIANSWPDPNEVFAAVPFVHGHYPLVFVTFMTFTLILSSVTMVRAVQEGHNMNRSGVLFWLSLTILGGLTFVGSQA